MPPHDGVELKCWVNEIFSIFPEIQCILMKKTLHRYRKQDIISIKSEFG